MLLPCVGHAGLMIGLNNLVRSLPKVVRLSFASFEALLYLNDTFFIF
jgi:hypothetical protein